MVQRHLCSPCLVPAFVECIHSLAIEAEASSGTGGTAVSMSHDGEAASAGVASGGDDDRASQVEHFKAHEVAALLDAVADQEGIYWLGMRPQSAEHNSLRSDSVGERCGPASPPDRIARLFHSLTNFEPSRLEARSILPSLLYNDH